MLSQGLVTIAGQGPKDSNGAGKSSLIAALSLLHADAQWRLANGAGAAADLLFTAEFAAQEGNWSNVDHGYVIGVFADAAADTEAELTASALSVWLRINRKAAHLDIRWRTGLYLPYGSTEAERAAGVDELWRGLRKSNGRTDYHANRLSAVLFGGHVRCVSFLSTSVRASPAANLLAQPLNDLNSRQIFHAIATLTGLDRELAKEQAMRSSECDERAKVLEIEGELARWEKSAEAIAGDIEHRRVSRELLQQAQRDWRGRCANWLLAGIERAAELTETIDQLSAELAELKEQEGEADRDIAGLTDQARLAEQVEELRKNYRLLEYREQELSTQIAVASQQCEQQSREQRSLRESARRADDRTPERAAEELAEAQVELEAALQAQGVAAATATSSQPVT
ncbi:MAG: chromosome segregation ATPase, partial [Angustibacter sp.]